MDNLNILSLNVRGLNSRARCDDTRLLVEDCRASIVCLQETKLDVVTNAFMLRLLGVQFTDFAYLPASDTRGGILIATRQGAASISDVHVGCFSLTVRVQTPGDEDPWRLVDLGLRTTGRQRKTAVHGGAASYPRCLRWAVGRCR